tara:strand:+ start:222 stop:935 length:714 start_codon:yes stop_codon:yes gene_type:complete
MTPLTAGIGAVGSLLGSALTNIGAKRREDAARKHNIKLWEMQNQYNLPANQMQRLKDAGLNPNLIYGSSPAGASGAAGSISPGKAAPYNIGDPTQSTALAALIPLQGQKLLAETAKTYEEAGVKGLEKGILKNNFNSLVEIQQYKTQEAYQSLLQSQIETYVKTKTQQQMVEQAIQNLALTKNKVSQSKWEANISKVKSNFADKGINLGDKIWIRLVGLALNAMGLQLGPVDLTPDN